MSKIVSHLIAGTAGVVVASIVWWAAMPTPAPIPPKDVSLKDIRGLVHYLTPIAFDYGTGDYMADIKQADRVSVCVHADDSVSVKVDMSNDSPIYGFGPNLHAAEMDLGRKAAALSNLMN